MVKIGLTASTGENMSNIESGTHFYLENLDFTAGNESLEINEIGKNTTRLKFTVAMTFDLGR